MTPPPTVPLSLGAFKTTPTPSEMAFDPLPQILSFLSWRRFFFLEKKIRKNFWKKKFRRLAPAPVFDLKGRNQQ